MGGGTGITCEAGRITARDRGLISHVENFEKTPMVRNVMTQRSSFAGQALDSYDVSCASGVDRPDPGSYRLNPREPVSRDYAPSTLIAFLDGFVDEPFDITVLGYMDVRDDIRRWNSFTQRIVRPVIQVSGGFTAGVAGIGLAFAKGASVDGSLAMAGFCVAVSTLGIAGWIFSSSRYANPIGTHGEAEEFSRLHRSAIEADEFMRDVYFPYFVRKTLDEEVK
ncbi:MAG: hypothetical protein Q8P81_04250 [Nanoarchaeota archaeon]|nr:hypothetical protein [Nanoarchaeota archaeon]